MILKLLFEKVDFKIIFLIMRLNFYLLLFEQPIINQ